MNNSETLVDFYKTLNILCVEDDINILENYKMIFSMLFKNVYFANDGKKGFESFQNEHIDIVLTDFMMPVCNGLEMSKKIRKVDATIPIIMVTALENIGLLRDALDINITAFLQKPFTKKSLFDVFNLAVKSVLADRIMLKEQKSKIEYSSYQENLTFQKEKLIAKNDFHHSKKLASFSCDLYYKPLDILSGDSYVLREIRENEYFIFLVDGMGKGISASLTAMLCSSYINYYINNIIQNKEVFDFSDMMKKVYNFIQPNLLEDEVVSAHFIYYNDKLNEIQYSIFSMPPILYLLDDKNINKIRSNNTPLASYSKNFKIDKLCVDNISKMIIYTDGLNENSVKDTDEPYTNQLKSDFANSKNEEEFQKLMNQNITTYEDDISYIFLQKL